MFPGESAFILSGSLLSALGSIFIIICHTHLGVNDSVRTKLIFCLAVADLLNALNNSASGFVSVAGIPLADGPLCTLNGFVGQWTVVASDFSVLAIAIATVTAVTRPLKWYSKSTWVQKYVAWIIGVIWIYALITALVALFAVGYSQSAANWCWINKTPFYARYALTHIPRMIIILSIFVAYAFVYVFLKRMTKNPTRARSLSTGSARGEESGVGLSDQESEHSTESSSSKPSFSQRALSFSKSRRSVSEGNNKRDPILRLMRLMVIFPVVYTLLWLPGLANRLYDAVMPEGSQTPEFMEYLQGLTQYIGFANAVLYGLNDEILKAMKKKWGRSNSEASQTDSALEA